ncbi:HK97 family phage prohead protease [Sphingobium sp. TB-6]|uniref:HK97 family phage prohead protease n=1 Tax=Sphingobium sp. TB-6 TaxID=2728850 RepID=UPI00146E3921|nr:HK97 family phage prohead protease [Sphingobium sp. TB-6]NML88750.1 HK97 family phage prohead protease [Sphingobium sp. TB-6]
MMERSAFAFEVKNLDEAGYIEGVAAAYGNVDYGGDRIVSGAFAKSLQAKSSVPMLLFHDMRRPIGRWGKIAETDAGLSVEGKISTKTRDGGEAYELVRDKALSGLSIGYDLLRKRMDGKVRELIELDLHEVSLVSVGMNPLATITDVKNIREGGLPSLSQFESFLREAGFSKSEATAIAGKGLSHLLRGEPGGATGADFLSALRAGLSA